jgi:putative heme-binding domain-containing protein
MPPASEYRRHALLREGDAAKGRSIFFEWQSASCAQCHTTDGRSGKAGPDLFAVGDKFGRREIIESVLAPSASIAVGYSATSIETTTGEEYVGVIKQATDDWIELRGVAAQPVRIAASDIQHQRTSEVSLMPEGLHAALTMQEFTDLIEFLVSLKQPESATLVEHGMPGVIEPLAKPVALRPIIPEGLKFEHPVWFGPVPGASNVFLVVEHETGRIWRVGQSLTSVQRRAFEADLKMRGTPFTRPSDTLSPPRGEGQGEGFSKTLFAELGPYQKGTRGLLGMALHPRFRESRKYYYARHTMENGRFATLHFEGEAAADLKADSGKPPRLLLRIDAATNVHYGGGLEFGPDGYLYIGMGDTGPQEDPQGHAQNTKLLLGKLLRIDVDHEDGTGPYSIPKDNPFVGRADFRPEIWAYGFREPWRFTFDELTKDLWVGDVGQDRYEEVCVVRRGENHGWNVYEGFERFSNRYRRDGAAFAPPVFAYGRRYGPSVTGGYVYRANPQSSFCGVYLFGDYESRRIFGLTQTHRVLQTIRQIGTAPQRIVSFGRDAKGELYVVGYEGMIYQMDLAGAKFE